MEKIYLVMLADWDATTQSIGNWKPYKAYSRQSQAFAAMDSLNEQYGIWAKVTEVLLDDFTPFFY